MNQTEIEILSLNCQYPLNTRTIPVPTLQLKLIARMDAQRNVVSGWNHSSKTLAHFPLWETLMQTEECSALFYAAPVQAMSPLLLFQILLYFWSLQISYTFSSARSWTRGTTATLLQYTTLCSCETRPKNNNKKTKNNYQSLDLEIACWPLLADLTWASFLRDLSLAPCLRNFWNILGTSWCVYCTVFCIAKCNLGGVISNMGIFECCYCEWKIEDDHEEAHNDTVGSSAFLFLFWKGEWSFRHQATTVVVVTST